MIDFRGLKSFPIQKHRCFLRDSSNQHSPAMTTPTGDLKTKSILGFRDDLNQTGCVNKTTMRGTGDGHLHRRFTIEGERTWKKSCWVNGDRISKLGFEIVTVWEETLIKSFGGRMDVLDPGCSNAIGETIPARSFIVPSQMPKGFSVD